MYWICVQGLDLQYRQQPTNLPKMQNKQSVNHKQPVLGYATTAVTRNEQLILHHIDPFSPKERQLLISRPTEDILEIITYFGVRGNDQNPEPRLYSASTWIRYPKVYSILFLSVYYNPILHKYPVYNNFLLRKTLLHYRNNSNPARYQEITRSKTIWNNSYGKSLDERSAESESLKRHWPVKFAPVRKLGTDN